MASQAAMALRLKQAKKKQAKEQKSLLQQGQGQVQGQGQGLMITPKKLQPTWDEASELSGRSVLAGGVGGVDTVADHRLRAHKAYMKWLQKHRVDSFGPNYDSDGKNNSLADMMMWLGLAMVMTGTVISFIGLGEKGFRTRHLRLLGPVLIGAGLSLCLLRVALCCYCCCCCFTNNSTSSLKSHQLLMEELHLEEMNMKERLVKAVHFHQAVAMKTTAVPFNHFNDDFKVPAIQVDRETDARGRLLDDADDTISGRFSESAVNVDGEEMTTAVIENIPTELVLNPNGLNDNFKVNLEVVDPSRHFSCST